MVKLENILLTIIHDENQAIEVHVISCIPYNNGHKITFPSKNFTLSSDILSLDNKKCHVLEVADVVTCFINKEVKPGRAMIRDYFNGNEKYLKALRKIKDGKHGEYDFISKIFRCEKNKNLNSKLEIKEAEFDDINFYNENLNNSQRGAVSKAIKQHSFKLIGPPGTGKTTTVLEIIRQLLPTKGILVCGPSNTSIDNILLPFVQCEVSRKILRIGDSFKCHSNLKKYNLNFMVDSEMEYLVDEISKLRVTRQKTERQAAKDRRNNSKARDLRIQFNDAVKDKKAKGHKIRKELIKSADIIFSTLFGCLKIEERTFDIVIVDECCQAQDVELLLTILKGKQFILAGDPFQLGPVIDKAYHLEFYDRLRLDEHYLDEQYRMPSNLIEFSNAYFYNDIIKSSKNSNFRFFDESNLMFIDTYEDYYIEQDRDDSKCNIEEACLISDFLNYINTNRCNKFKDLEIGVIMPYSAQVAGLKELVDVQNDHVTISTVDSFQGQERDIIIISLVRSNMEDQIGFMKEIRRMNVAITRCKVGLVIIGNSDTFKKNVFFGEMIEFLYKNAFCIDPTNFRLLIS